MGERSRALQVALAVLWVTSLAMPAEAQVSPATGVQARQRPAPAPKPVPRPAAQQGMGMLKAVPLPPSRPTEIARPASPNDTAREVADKPDMAELETGVCMAAFSEKGEIIPRPAPEPVSGPEEACSIPGPLTFRDVKLKEGGEVRLETPITVRCSLALVIADWIREDLAPIARKAGTDLVRLVGVGGHACRTRNGQPGAQISEHASGNAFDLLALALKDGRTIELWRDDAETKDIRAQVRESACARFMTVLGPGADSAHANHVHLDMRARKNDFRMCQWDVK